MKSKQMALCGLLTALAVVWMIFSGSIGIGTYLGPVLAMVILLPIQEEYGGKTAAIAYVAAAILGLLLVPELELALVYAALGWYPLLRPYLNQIPGRLVRLVIKAGLFTAVILILYGLLLRMFGMTADLLESTAMFNLFLLILGVFTLLITDLAFDRLTFLWQKRLRKRFFR